MRDVGLMEGGRKREEEKGVKSTSGIRAFSPSRSSATGGP